MVRLSSHRDFTVCTVHVRVYTRIFMYIMYMYIVVYLKIVKKNRRGKWYKKKREKIGKKKTEHASKREIRAMRFIIGFRVTIFFCSFSSYFIFFFSSPYDNIINLNYFLPYILLL